MQLARGAPLFPNYPSQLGHNPIIGWWDLINDGWLLILVSRCDVGLIPTETFHIAFRTFSSFS